MRFTNKRRIRKLQFEKLESRKLLASDLYTLASRPGLPGPIGSSNGNDIAQNESYIAVGRPYQGYSAPQNGALGEVHIHSPVTGALLRTIANPEPDLLYHFGESVAIYGDLLVIGGAGLGFTDEDGEEGPFSNASGRAYIYSASTGQRLHDLLPEYEANPDFSPSYDRFGATVGIYGNYVVVGAPSRSPYDGNNYNWGHVFVYSASTGNLLRTINNPLEPVNATPSFNSFGSALSLQGTKLIVANPSNYNHQGAAVHPEVGSVYVYDVTTGALQHTLQVPAEFNVPNTYFGTGVDVFDQTIVSTISNVIPGAVGPFRSTSILVHDATTGNWIRTIPVGDNEAFGTPSIWESSVAIHYSKISSPPAPVVARVYDLNSGQLVDTAIAPINTNFSYLGTTDLFEDRLLASHYDNASDDKLVFAYTVSVSNNVAPTDISLAPSSAPENSANGTVVGTFTTTDPDVGDTFSYSLTNNAGGRFSVVGNELRVIGGLNFEVAATHNITVQVTDSSGNTYSEVMPVTVTNVNEPPTAINLTNDMVLHTAATGSIVGSFSAVDPDTPDTATFTLLNNAGGRFNLTGSILTVGDASLLNTALTHAINVRVTDSGGLTHTQSFFIKVISPPTDLQLIDSYVVEGSANGTPVAIINDPTPFDTLLDFEEFASSIVSYGGRTAFANAQNNSGNTIDAGAVYIRNDSTGEIELTLNPPDPATALNFGRSIAFNENYIVVGAIRILNSGDSYAGSYYTYDANTGSLLHGFVIPSSIAAGASVALRGQTMLVGAIGTLNSRSVIVVDAANGNVLANIADPDSSFAHFGSEVAFAPSGQIIVASPGLNGGGRVYVFNATNYSLEHTLANPNPQNSEGFGTELEFFGNTILVGAYGQDIGGVQNSGAVYRFSLLDGQLLQTLVDPNPVAEGFFGLSIRASATDIAVAGDVGHVYLFSGLNGLLNKTFTGGPNERVTSIAFNSDGLVAGYSQSQSSYAGEARIFDLETGLPLSSFRVFDNTPTGANAFTLLDNAGGRFAIVGNQLVVANGALIDAEQASAYTIEVRVTDGTGLTFTKSFQIKVIGISDTTPTDITISTSSISESTVRYLHNPSPDKLFGAVVSTSGNLAAVSLLDRNFPQTGPNQVEIYNAATGGSVQTLESPNPNSSASGYDGGFGENVLLTGNTAIVSAPRANVGNVQNAGQAFVFNATTGSLVHTLASPIVSPDGRFGQSLAVSNDFIAVGAFDDVGAVQSGSVYLFNPSTGASIVSIPNPSPAIFDGFGHAISAFGNNLVVGAPGDDFGQPDSGRAYVYQFNPSTNTAPLRFTLNNPNAGPGSFFGSDVALSNDFIAVSAPSSDIGNQNSGVAYVFRASTGAFLRTIQNPNPETNDRFGDRIKIVGKYLFVSSENNAGLQKVGQFHVFDMTTGNLFTTLQNPNPTSNDLFGIGSAFHNFSVDGARLVIGASGDDLDGANYGLVYVSDLAYGQVIGTLGATDLDATERFKYNVVNSDGRFAIDGDKLIVADASKLDFETNATHTVSIQVADAAGLFFVKNLTIQVIDVDESIGQGPNNIKLSDTRVLENASTGTLVSALDNPSPPSDSLSNGLGRAMASVGNFLALAGAGDSQANSSSSSVIIVSPVDGSLIRTISNPNPQQPGFGNSLAGTSTRLAVGNAFDDTDGQNAGKVFVFDPNNGNLLFTLSPPGAQANQRFGTSVAINANFIVVGTTENKVFVFNATTGAFLYSLAPVNASEFGFSVGLAENRVLVSDQSVASGTGIVYVYNATTGAQLYSVSPPNSVNVIGSANKLFGSSISVDGSRFAVGSIGNDTQSRDAGAVYLYDLSNGNLLQTLFEPTPGKSNNFGSGVYLNGDRLAVYSQGDDTNGEESGRVHLFNSFTGAYIRAIDDPQPTVGAQFGNAIAFVGPRLFIGANNNNINLTRPGQVIAYQASDGLLSPGITAFDPNPNETFTYQLLDSAGGRFSLVGNQLVVANGSLLNFESSPTHSVVIQATDSTGNTFSKNLTIEVINVPETAPSNIILIDRSIVEHAPIGTSVATIDNPEPNQSEGFGSAMDEFGNNLVVGNSRDDLDGVDAGIVYIKNTKNGITLHTLHNPNPDPGDLFGASVAVDDDFVVVGAPQDDTLANNAGRAYVYNRTTGALLHKLSFPNPGANHGFGISVATDGINIAVGTENSDRAFVFKATTGELLYTLSSANSGFGASVSISDSIVAVGAPRYDAPGATDIGRVYVYYAPNGILLETIDSPIQSSGAHNFGASVSVLGENIAIGAPGYDGGATDTGRAYWYYSFLEGTTLLETFNNPTPDAGDRFGKLVVTGPNRIAVGTDTSTNASVYLYDRQDGSLERTLNSSSTGATFFGRAFAIQDSNVMDPVLFVGSSIQTGGVESGQIEAFDVFSGFPLSGFDVDDVNSGDRFTYELLDSAGGRFSLSNGRLFVASNAIDFEAASSHTVIVRATDSSGLSVTRSLVIQLIDVPEVITFAKVDSVVFNGSASNPNRSGIRTIQLNFTQPVTVTSASSLVLRNHTTGALINLANATLTGNGTASITWLLSNVTLPNGRYTAELAANQALNSSGYRLENTYVVEFHKRAGDVNGDGVVNTADYTEVGLNFNPVPGVPFRRGDADGSGAVNTADYTAVGLNFAPAPLLAIAKDFGDAPELSTNYATTLSRDGARHITGTLFLGASVDSESDGLPNADATGDGADENGVVWGLLTRGQTTTVVATLTTSATVYVNAWIDLNGDGDWNDAGEQVLKDATGINGSNSYPIHIPGTTSSGSKFARVRMGSTPGVGPSGLATNGEVEDYQIFVAEPSLLLLAPSLKPNPKAKTNDSGHTRFMMMGSSANSPDALDAFFENYSESTTSRRRRTASLPRVAN